MHVSIDWFKDLNNKTGSACSASADVDTKGEVLAWLKGIVLGIQLDEEHTGQIVVDGYAREDLKAEVFRKTTFVVSRKPYTYKEITMPAPISERIIPDNVANDNSIRVYERRTISDRVSFQFTRAPHCDDKPEANLWYGQWVDTTEEQYAKEQKGTKSYKLSQAEREEEQRARELAKAEELLRLLMKQ